MAAGLRFWLAPARLLRAPIDEVALTLLLSLRFMSIVFDEVRNLALGLAARGVPWRELPSGGGVQVMPSSSMGAGLPFVPFPVLCNPIDYC